MVEILKKDKILFSVILSACIFLNGIFSSEDFISPKVIDVRSLSLGDLYITDYNSPYILFTNPAGLSVTGKKTLLAPSNMDLGGPLSAIPSVISNAIKSDNIFQSLVAGLLSETLSSNENFLDFETLLPLSFVRINKNNGVGFINRLFVNRAISVDSNTNFSFGLEGLFIIGNSSTIIKTKRQVLSVGTSTKLLGRMDVNHTDTVENFLNIDFMNLPVRGTLAIGMDVGIQYSLLKFFSVAAVWQNAFLGLEKNLNTLTDLSFSQEGVIPNIFLNKGNLNLGLSLSLPIAFTKGIISNWKIYANYHDALSFFTDSEEKNNLFSLSSLTCGMELIIFKTIAMRLGFTGSDFSVGAGIDLTPFHMEFAIYKKERVFDSTVESQLHGALGISFYW